MTDSIVKVVEDSIVAVLENYRQGDPLAEYQIDQRLRAELLALVRSQRNKRYRAQVDSEAVVNDALNSFLRWIRGDKFVAHDFKCVLSCVAVRILVDQIRAVTRQKRGGNDRQHVAASQYFEPIAPGPTPQQCVEAVEDFEKFGNVVRDVHEMAIPILEKSIQGMTKLEIARDLDLGVRTVQKIIKEMIERWKSDQNEPGS